MSTINDNTNTNDHAPPEPTSQEVRDALSPDIAYLGTVVKAYMVLTFACVFVASGAVLNGLTQPGAPLFRHVTIWSLYGTAALFMLYALAMLESGNWPYRLFQRVGHEPNVTIPEAKREVVDQ